MYFVKGLILIVFVFIVKSKVSQNHKFQTETVDGKIIKQGYCVCQVHNIVILYLLEMRASNPEI